MDDRSSPPHILNQDILTSGELEPTPMTLTGRCFAPNYYRRLYF